MIETQETKTGEKQITAEGKYEDAINTYLDSLDLKKKVYKCENNSIAETYNNIGVTCYWSGQYKDALDWHFEAKRIREDILPPNHPDLAET